MKKTFKILACLIGWLALTVAAHAQNPCVDTETKTYQCLYSGTTNTLGVLSYTNLDVCIGETIVPPTATATMFLNGSYQEYDEHSCTNYVNSYSTNDETYVDAWITGGSYVATNVYFVPPIPTSFDRATNFQCTAFVDGWDEQRNCEDIIGIVLGTVTITCTSAPPIISSQPVSQTVFAGSNVTFSVVATGCPTLAYQWYFNQTNLLGGATNSSLSLTNVQLTNAGSYSVTVSDPSSSTNSAIAGLTVQTSKSYIELSGSLTNYTFRRDATYYVRSTVNLYGTNILEGSAVIKFTNSINPTANPPTGAGIALVGSNAVLKCQTGLFRPAIFTAKDDDSVGEVISGSTGVPTNYYGGVALSVNYGQTGITANLHDIHIAYLAAGIAFNGGTGDVASDAQVVNCYDAFLTSTNDCSLRNVLVSAASNIFLNASGTVRGENVTFAQSANFYGNTPPTVWLTNSLVVAVTNGVSYSGANNHTVTNAAGAFQTVGAGHYYLNAASDYRHTGTTNINDALRNDLKVRTTYPPFVITNLLSAGVTLMPQAQRDAGDLGLDLGYHYAPIDFIALHCIVTNCVLSVSNGAVIACCNDVGFFITCGSSINSVGTPLAPNWFVRYSSVQEGRASFCTNGAASGVVIEPSQGATGLFEFSDFACPAGCGTHLYNTNSASYGSLLVQNCEFWSGQNLLAGSSNSVIHLENNLFNRSTLIANTSAPQSVLSLSNNLVWGTATISLNQPSNATWAIFDNDFDSCNISSAVLTNGYNAYLNCVGRIYPTNAHDVVQSDSLSYLSSFLGDYYQPTNGALNNAGSKTNATLVGLFHFTTTSNQVKEGNSPLDIGYHYVAVDANGYPVDSNTNGIPDYLEDTNNNGRDDTGESPWSLAIVSQPQSQEIAQGGNFTLSVSVVGVPPLSYQWQRNGTNISGATASSYSNTNAQSGDAGSYHVIVSNIGGSVTSAEAVVAVAVAPAITAQPASQAVVQGTNATFSVGASGSPLDYQWRWNGTNIVGATDSNYTLSSVLAADAGNYSVVITNLAGSVTSSNALLTVYIRPVITVQPTDQTLLQGTNATFGVTVAGTSPLSYQWFSGTNLIAGWTNASLTLTNIQAANAGSYSVRVTNLYGATTSSNALLTVLVPPAITAQPGSQTVVQGTNATLSVLVSSNSTPPLSYQWYFNGTNLINGATASSYVKISAQPADAGSYSVVITNIAGAVTSSPATISVIIPPVILSQPTNETVFQNTAASFGVSATGTASLHYQWYFNTTNALSGATNTSLAIGSCQSSNAGSYSVVVSNIAGVVTSSQALLNVNVAPSVTGPQSTNVIEGSSVMLSVSASGTMPLAYQWRKNGSNYSGATASTLIIPFVSVTDQGSYSVVVSNIAGTATSASAFLTVTIPPSVSNQPVDQVIAQGGAASFTVAASGSATLTYQWYTNGVAIANGSKYAGVTSNTLWVSNATAADVVVYSVSVSNNGGSITSTGARLSIVGTDRVIVNGSIPEVSGSATIALGSSIVLQAVPSSTPSGVGFPLGYPVWSASDSTLTLPGAGSITATITPTNAGSYTIWASCGNSNSFTLTVNSTNDANYDGIVDNLENTSNPPNLMLGFWSFDTPDFGGLQGQMPLVATNIVSDGGWSILAAQVNSANGAALLSYREAETNATVSNINLRRGTVRFLFNPDWSSTNAGGYGPGYEARLIEVGDKSASTGSWGVYVDSGGTSLTFCSKTNAGNLITNLTAPIQWTNGSWYQIDLTYSSTNAAFYINGSLLTNNASGITAWPGATVRAAGFKVGCGVDASGNGTNWAQGSFDNLATYNYPWSGPALTNYYAHHPQPVATNTCLLAPIALYVSAATTLTNGQTTTTTNAAGNGNFAWLTWYTNQGNTYDLAAALTNWAWSQTFTNAQNPSDTTLSTGDWIWGNPGWNANASVTASLDWLINTHAQFGVVLWNQYSTNQTGNNLQYRAAEYAKIQLLSYDGTGNPKTITYKYLGTVSCDSYSNQPPTTQIISPTNNQIFSAPSNNTPTIQIIAAAYDPEDNLKRVEFYWGTNDSICTNLIGVWGTTNAAGFFYGRVNDATNLYSLYWTNTPHGSNSIKTIAYDELSQTGTSLVCHVIVNWAPTVTTTSITNVWNESNSNLVTNLTSIVWDDGLPFGQTNYSWTVLLSNGPVTLGNSNSASATATLTTNGTYQFQLTVDDGNSSVFNQCYIKILRRPFVNITYPGSGETVFASSEIRVSANAYDYDGNVTNVQFSYVFNGVTNAIPTSPDAGTNSWAGDWINAPIGTNITLIASATDNDNLTKTSSIPVTIISPNPSVQIVSPTNYHFLARTVTDINAVATQAVSDSPITNVQFFISNGITGFNFASTNSASAGYYSVKWRAATNGTYVFTALATDSRGSNAWSSPVTNYVWNIPNVTIISPTNGQMFLGAPTNIIIQALAIPDPSTVITNVTFYQGTNYQPSNIIGVSASGVSNVFTVTWNGVTNGTYIVSAKAFDTNGGVNISAPISIIVKTNQAPSVYAANQTIILSTNALQMTGFVSDDGLPFGALSINWTNLGGSANAILTVTNQQVTAVQFLATGTYQFVLSANDGQYTTFSTNTITVLSPNQPPVVSAGTNRTVVLAASYIMTNHIVNSTTSDNLRSSQGTDFWIGFPQNFYGDDDGSPPVPAELTLFISSDKNTFVSVMAPGVGFFTNCNLSAGVTASIRVPPSVQVLTDDQVEGKGIHVVAQDNVSVYGLTHIEFTSDAYCALPTTVLGTNYVVLGYQAFVYEGVGWPGHESELLIVGTKKGTRVTVIPSFIDVSGNHPAGTPYSFNLDEGQTYQLKITPGDVSGTVVTADKPVAVFGGAALAFVPDSSIGWGDVLVEQMTPVNTWGRYFFTAPLHRTIPGDVFQIVASENNTTVTVLTNGVSQTMTLNQGSMTNFMLFDPSQIDASKPILLAQYATGSKYPDTDLYDSIKPNEPGDPLMMLIPPFEQLLTSYTVTTPSFPTNEYNDEGLVQEWTNFANILVTNTSVGTVYLDNAVIDATNFFPIVDSGFSYAQIPLLPGSHHLYSPKPFGIFMYGLAWDDDSYGYPGGMSLGSVANVANILLAQKIATNEINSTYCIIATVSDTNNQSIAGIRVDFETSASNSLAGSAYTDENGQARFCYAGTNLGMDSITASIGTNSDFATNVWVRPAFTLDGSVSDDGLPVGITNILWTQVGGPPVVIPTPQITNPVVQVTEPGFYSFKLTADDTVLTNSAQVGITVLRNQPPSVDAASPQFTKSSSLKLNGSVSDDGLPNGTLHTRWSKLNGPGSVTFDDATQPATTATFSTPGVYILRLTGDDSQAAVYVDVTVSVLINPQSVECEQAVTGNLASTDLHSIELTNSYANYYEFLGQSNQFFTVTMTSTNFDSYLIIRNQQLQLLAEDNDSFDATLGSTNSKISFCLPADGVYIIEATSALGNQMGAYQLQFHCGLPDEVTITSPVNGTVYPNVPAHVSVAATVANFGSPNVTLYTNGTRLVDFDTSDHVAFTTDWSSVPAGTYSLTAVATRMDYLQNFYSITSAPVVIKVGMPTVVLDPVTNCIKLLPGSDTITATLEDPSGNPTPGPITFTVLGANPTNVTITTSSGGVASFTYTATNAGSDLIVASATLGGLSTSTAAERDWAQPMLCEQYADGALDFSSGTSSRGGYADYYSFYGQSNDIVVITMTSWDFDTYLNLRDTGCNLVASNDDFSGADAQITYTLPAAGGYIIEATSSMPEQIGDYSIQIDCNPNQGASGGVPQLAVFLGSQPLSNYGTVDFGATTVTNPISMSFTISNVGTAPLIIGPVVKAGDFSVTNWPTAPVSVGGSTSFVVQFNAVTNEIQLGQVGFGNNDQTASPFILNLTATANIVGAPPTVSLTDPTNSSVYAFGTNIVVTANPVATTNFTITNVDFVSATGSKQLLIGVATNAPYTINWVNPNAGNYALFAVATDSAGRVGYSSPAVNVQVLPPPTPNHSPVAVTDNVTVFAGSHNNTIYPLGNDYDPDGDQLTIMAVQPSTLSPSHPVHGIPTILPGGKSISYTPPPGQGYPIDGFSYEISDGKGGTAWGGVVVTAFAPAVPKVIITNPPPPYPYPTNAGALTPLIASVTPSQYITKVDFYLGETFLGEVTNGVNGSYTLNWTASYDSCNCPIVASATDSFGQVGVSDPIHITVTAPINGPNGTSISPDAVFDSYTGSDGVPQPLTNGVSIQDGIINVYGRAYHPLGSNDIVWQLGVYTQDGKTLIRDLTPQSLTNSYHPGTVGSSTMSNILTTCDLTTLQNGPYDLKLTVMGGLMITNTDVQFILNSNLKIGQFSFSQQDLVIPVNGIPLTITRTYNSLNPNKGDFGYGWSMALNSMDVAIDESRQIVSDDDGKSFSQRSGGGRDVTLTLPNGHRVTFYYRLEKRGSLGTYYAIWQLPPGEPEIQSFVPQCNNELQTILGVAGPDAPLYWQAAGPGVPMDNFDFPGFILTMNDGTQYIINREPLGEHYMGGDTDLSGQDNEVTWGNPFLAQIIERNHNTISIDSSSVTFTSADGATNRAVFHRNNDGLIDWVSDPNGLDASGNATGPHAVKYEYDGFDNLINVERLVDSSGSGTYVTNSFAYTNANFPHYITGMFNGDGTQVAKNFYDDNGKLIAVQDANGKLTQFIHDPTNNMEVVVDRLGRTNTYVYDLHGNVTIETNALGQVTLNTYDDSNNLRSTTDSLNQTTRYDYDSFGNRTNVVDALNHTNSFTYSSGLLITHADPVGNVTTNVYDGAGNLTSTAVLDSQGNTIQQSSSVYSGNSLIQALDPNGRTNASFGYDPATGYMTSAADANGLTKTFNYDANGHMTNSSYTGIAPDGTQVPVTTSTIYDSLGRATMTIDADGNTNSTFYDINGKVSYTVDKFGNTNSMLYDARGNLIQTTYPTGTFIRNVYNDNSQIILVTDPNQITGTLTEYDAAGRVTNTVRLANVQVDIVSDSSNPTQKKSVIIDGGTAVSSSSTTYYANGWVQSRTGADGQTTTYDYWPTGQTKTVTDPLHHTTYYEYDDAGKQKLIGDALNHTNQFVYDAVGRMIATVYADNSYTSNVFNNVGQRTGQVDQAKLQTQFGYNVSGQLTNVIKPQVFDPSGNPVNPTWSYTYDQYGRLTVSTDPLTRTNNFFYDQQGRQIGQRLPMGQTATNFYNSKGQLWKQYDFKGQRTEFVYDRFSRTRAKFLFQKDASIPDESVCYIYNNLNQLTEVVERYGADATTNACDGYAALVDFPPDNISNVTRFFRAANRNPNTSAGLIVIALTALALLVVPREKRRAFTASLQDAWCTNLAPVLGFDTTEPVLRRSRRLSLPAWGWRLTTFIALVAYLSNEPGFNQLWTARADCPIPANDISKPTTRYTYFDYDNDGHLGQVNSPEGVINYGYDAATGRLTETCTANSEEDYGYDEMGRLQTVTVLRRNGQTLSSPETTTYHYDAVGNRSEVDLPNGVVTSFLYDNLNRLTNLVHQAGTTNLATYSYELDPTGRRTNAVEILRTESTGTQYITNTISWQYDGMYRLTNEACACSIASTGYTNSFQYDQAGNRVKKIRAGAGADTVTYQYNENDQLTNEVSSAGATAYYYDENGSLTNKTVGSTSTVNSYTYDVGNKLRTFSVNGSLAASYLYNEQGIRVQSTIHGATKLYLIDANNHSGYAQVREELSSLNSKPSTGYVIGDEVLAQCGTTAATLSYFLMDGHGSNRQLTQSDGSVSSHYNYEAYGEVQSGSSSSTAELASTTKLFCGEQYDSALGMYNLRARYYNPSNGRFASLDPFGGFQSDPASLHKYTYCNGDPINGSDPSGYFDALSLIITIGVLAIVGAALAVAINGVNNYATGKPFFGNAGKAALTGAIAGPLVYAFPVLGLILAGIGLYSAGTTAYQVFTNPNSTAGQKGAALFLVGLSLFGSYGAGKNVQANGLWTNAAFFDSLSSIESEQGFFSQSLDAIRGRVGEFSDTLSETPLKGRITMAVGVAEDSSGNRLTLIGTSEKNGYIRPQLRSMIRPDDVVVRGGGHAEADIVSYARANNLKLVGVGATRPICNSCAQSIADAGAAAATPLKDPPLTMWDLLED